MKWMITEDKLGKDQIEAIDEIGKNNSKPFWIKGHAGSGKSVLLLHALNDYLARHPKANVCVVVFTNALVDLLENGLQQIPSLKGKAIPVYTIYDFKSRVLGGSKYDAIFCDEVQDLPQSFLALMKSSGTKIIVAGDASQSIYNSVPNFKEAPATPEEINAALEPLQKELSIVYRLTKSMLNVLNKVFPVMLSSKTSVEKADTSIEVWRFVNEHAGNEIPFIWQKAQETNRNRPSEVMAIMISSHDSIVHFCNQVLELGGKEKWTRVNQFDKPNYSLLNAHLARNGVPLMYVGNKYGSLKNADDQNKIVIMTFHSAKGLDFDTVILPLANDDMFFHPEAKAKELLLVALSRSKNELVISYTGRPHPVLSQFIAHLPVKEPVTNTQDELDF